MDGTGRQNGKAFDSLLNPTLRPATSHLASLVGFCVAVIVRRRGRGDRLLHFLRDIVVSAVRYLVQTLSLSALPPSLLEFRCGQNNAVPPSLLPSPVRKISVRARCRCPERAWSRCAVSFDPLNRGRRRNEGTKGSRRRRERERERGGESHYQSDKGERKQGSTVVWRGSRPTADRGRRTSLQRSPSSFRPPSPRPRSTDRPDCC